MIDKIIIVGTDDLLLISQLFDRVNNVCENIIDELKYAEMKYVFDNPKWGYEFQKVNGKRYQLVLELKEIDENGNNIEI